MGQEEKSPSVPEEKSYSVRLPVHVWARLKEQSKREGFSMNSMINHCIIAYLNKRGYNLDMVEDFTDQKRAEGENEEKPSPESNIG
jgi:predicted DNA-binding protein